jgi:hypothetical protein
MAEALFAAEVLSPEACERLAASLHLELAEFRACVDRPATDRRLDADLEWVKTASPKGLPAVWVQEELFYGVHPPEALRAALERAEQRLERRGRAGGTVPASSSGDSGR